MVLLADHVVFPLAPPMPEEAGARRDLRAQVASLERQLGEALASGFPQLDVDVAVAAHGGPRLLDLGELETLRDELAARLADARRALAAQAQRTHEARLALEAMLADPCAHRFARLPRAALGVPGCGAYEVRPRLGLVGMLMGWWRVKLSSGCPAPGRGEPAADTAPGNTL